MRRCGNRPADDVRFHQQCYSPQFIEQVFLCRGIGVGSQFIARICASVLKFVGGIADHIVLQHIVRHMRHSLFGNDCDRTAKPQVAGELMEQIEEPFDEGHGVRPSRFCLKTDLDKFFASEELQRLEHP